MRLRGWDTCEKLVHSTADLICETQVAGLDLERQGYIAFNLLILESEPFTLPHPSIAALN